jgi:hypothetical protein
VRLWRHRTIFSYGVGRTHTERHRPLFSYAANNSTALSILQTAKKVISFKDYGNHYVVLFDVTRSFYADLSARRSRLPCTGQWLDGDSAGRPGVRTSSGSFLEQGDRSGMFACTTGSYKVFGRDTGPMVDGECWRLVWQGPEHLHQAVL